MTNKSLIKGQHGLDRPVWNALTTRQNVLARGDMAAVCFDPDYSPFGAAADTDPNSLAGLSRLIPHDGAVWTVEVPGFPMPMAAKVARQSGCHQMIALAITPGHATDAVTRLDQADAGQMHRLALLTKPGPFLPKTHRLGRFVGIFDGETLVAMAGERLQPLGFTEVSGVCTHVDYRGRGYAAMLMRHVAERIIARGEIPFLHAYSSNAGAIALYETLGFQLRREMTLTVLTRA